MERATGTEVYGCGTSQSSDITLNIQTTTGGNFSISLNGKNTVEHLKRVVSKKLKVGKDRICLLHRERQLMEGTLEENGLLDGSRVILLPSVETGLLSQRPENSVMQALESLNETQVNDFLSGKSPLNLTMRLGDHMMLIQLQLSTLNSSSSSRSLRTLTPNKASTSTHKCDKQKSPSILTTPEKVTASDSESSSDSIPDKTSEAHSSIHKQSLEILKNTFDLYQSLTDEKTDDKADSDKEAMDTSNCTISDLSDTSSVDDQSPIESLSNLVSSPLSSADCRATIANAVRSSFMELLSNSKEHGLLTINPTEKQTTEAPMSPEGSVSNDSDHFIDQSSFLAESTIDEYPMENLFNNAVDKGLFDDHEETIREKEVSSLVSSSQGTEPGPSTSLPSFQTFNEPLKAKRIQYLLHKTSKFKHPINQNKQKAFMQSVVNKHKKRMQQQDAVPSTSRTEPFITNSRKLVLQQSTDTDDLAVPSTSQEQSPASPKTTVDNSAQIEPKDLLEASKNLTQKLKKLSKEVLTNKIDLRTAEESVRSKIGPGAVIESMKHHGKGIYSGTFSGTLNPALQDRYGRPKRDISTIIHILNDLLCATPPITLTQKESKHAQTTKQDENKCNSCKSLHSQCVGHASTSRTSCPTQERLKPDSVCLKCANKSTGEICNKCDVANTFELDNTKTKCKLEQLRLVMQQKKQRREARKLKTLPYTTNKGIGSPEPNLQEEVDTVA